MHTNALILAAGFSSRFTPLSLSHPKGLTPVRGEILIERQIRQLKEAGISEIAIVTGCMKEQFAYLEKKWAVRLIENPDYRTRNNHSSIYAARDFLGNSYICSSDNYFPENLFLEIPEKSSYCGLYAPGPTDEWCMETDSDGRIRKVTTGGSSSWYMLGPAYWTANFTRTYLPLLEEAYPRPETASLYWEDLLVSHLDLLPMYLRPCPDGSILEFDTVADLAKFDPSYQNLAFSNKL
ncbi:MAG: NTP transferase domain-containing protein [Eubacteriales bacterium]|nr:NTP transferase domain-containing protein [Eubacteriales bacterium]